MNSISIPSNILTVHEYSRNDTNERIGLIPSIRKFASIHLTTNRFDDDEGALGSDILKSLNFVMHPEFQRSRKKNRIVRHSIVEQLKNQVSEISKASKNLKLMEKKRIADQTCGPSLVIKPKRKQAHIVVKGTLSILTNENTTPRLPSIKKFGSETTRAREPVDMSVKTSDKFRLDIMCWLTQNRKEVIAKINNNQQIMISWVVYLNYINRTEFDEMLGAIGIAYDANMFDRLFRLFDLNDNGVIDQKEVLATLDLFKEHSFEQRLKIFFELADDDNRGFLDEEKLVKFFKKNLTSEDDIKKVRPAVRILLAKELNLTSKSMITKEIFGKACEDIPALKAVVEANVTHSKPNKPAKALNANFLTNHLELGRDGYSAPYMQRLAHAFEEKGKIAQKYNNVQKEYVKMYNYLQEVAGVRQPSDHDI